MEGALNQEQRILPSFDGEGLYTPRLIVVLEQAFLESVKNRDRYQLLNVDDHLAILKKAHRPADVARPDITHQTLLSLLDSPLNKAGRLQVWIHTAANAVIKVDPSVRLPRTFKRFCGLMVQLLHKMNVRATEGNRKLLSVVKGPVEAHLPKNVEVVQLSRTAGAPVRLPDLVTELTGGKPVQECKPVVFVIGAIAHGHIDVEYKTRSVAISSYPLSAASVASRVCTAFEDAWGIH